MSGDASVDVRNCPKCGQGRATVTKQEDGKIRAYYQCLGCNPGWASHRATVIRSYPFPAPSYAPPPGAPVAGP
jgi:hypothetical protein